MPDKYPTPGYDANTAHSADTPDGVNDAPPGAGEGGAYPNPHTGKTERGGGGKLSGFMGHGGQSEIAYHGPGHPGDADDNQVNAATSRKLTNPD